MVDITQLSRRRNIGYQQIYQHDLPVTHGTTDRGSSLQSYVQQRHERTDLLDSELRVFASEGLMGSIQASQRRALFELNRLMPKPSTRILCNTTLPTWMVVFSSL